MFVAYSHCERWPHLPLNFVYKRHYVIEFKLTESKLTTREFPSVTDTSDLSASLQVKNLLLNSQVTHNIQKIQLC
jgi:hypothetical protein